MRHHHCEILAYEILVAACDYERRKGVKGNCERTIEAFTVAVEETREIYSGLPAAQGVAKSAIKLAASYLDQSLNDAMRRGTNAGALLSAMRLAQGASAEVAQRVVEAPPPKSLVI